MICVEASPLCVYTCVEQKTILVCLCWSCFWPQKQAFSLDSLEFFFLFSHISGRCSLLCKYTCIEEGIPPRRLKLLWI